MQQTHVDDYKFKLYLEGVEVSLISASISYSQGGGSCSLMIPASGAMAQVYARTQVQLFFKNGQNEVWRILFAGEVHGVRYSKGSRGTTMSLNCHDMSSYFDQLYRYYMRDADQYSANYKVIRVFAASVESRESHVGHEVRTDSVPASDSSLDQSRNIEYTISDIQTLVKNVLNPMLDTNKYTRKLAETYRLNDIIYSLKDEYIGKTFMNSAINNMLKGRPLSNMETMRSIISNAISTVYYNMAVVNPSSSGTASEGNTKLRSILFVPDCPMAPPPMCNVIYPNQAQLVDFNSSLTASPTRISMASRSFSGDKRNSTFTYVAVAPSELTDGLKDKQYLHGEITPYEEIRGIMPIVREMPFTNLLMGMSKAEEQPEANEFGLKTMIHLAEYELLKNQLMNTTVTSSGMPFNPNLAVGFTCAIISSPIIVRGKVTTISHSISKYSYSTSISLSYAKSSPLYDKSEYSDQDGKDLLDWTSQTVSTKLKDFLQSKGEYNATFPAFVNDKFTPKDSDYGYSELLGVHSTSNVLDDPIHTPMISAIRDLNEEYETAKISGTEFSVSKRNTFRPVATIDQFYAFYNEEVPKSGNFKTGNFFNKIRQDVIIEHNKEVGGV